LIVACLLLASPLCPPPGLTCWALSPQAARCIASACPAWLLRVGRMPPLAAWHWSRKRSGAAASGAALACKPPLGEPAAASGLATPITRLAAVGSAGRPRRLPAACSTDGCCCPFADSALHHCCCCCYRRAAPHTPCVFFLPRLESWALSRVSCAAGQGRGPPVDGCPSCGATLLLRASRFQIWRLVGGLPAAFSPA
jgi:hypothetical protein